MANVETLMRRPLLIPNRKLNHEKARNTSQPHNIHAPIYMPQSTCILDAAESSPYVYIDLGAGRSSFSFYRDPNTQFPQKYEAKLFLPDVM